MNALRAMAKPQVERGSGCGAKIGKIADTNNWHVLMMVFVQEVDVCMRSICALQKSNIDTKNCNF